MKQTAVDWLLYKLEIFATEEEMNIIEQAKEMEKEQIIKFAETYEEYCHNSFTQNRYVQVKSAEQYYNETFKSE